MQMVVSNGDEKIIISEINRSGDTVTFAFPIFTSEIIAVLKGDSMVGSYYPKGKVNGNAYGFKAIAGITDRYSLFRAPAEVNVTGRWKVVENPGTPDSSVMVGEFRQDSNRVTGTFLNTGGDYRYLQGKVSGRNLYLSAVDGAHTFVFTAELPNDSTIVNGRFMGSPKWKSYVGRNKESERHPAAGRSAGLCKKRLKALFICLPRY